MITSTLRWINLNLETPNPNHLVAYHVTYMTILTTLNLVGNVVSFGSKVAGFPASNMHNIAVFVVWARLRPLIFETLKTPNQVGEGVKNTVFLQGAQKVDF